MNLKSKRRVSKYTALRCHARAERRAEASNQASLQPLIGKLSPGHDGKVFVLVTAMERISWR